MKAASWRSAEVFRNFYNKPVATVSGSFGEAILPNAIWSFTGRYVTSMIVGRTFRKLLSSPLIPI